MRVMHLVSIYQESNTGKKHPALPVDNQTPETAETGQTRCGGGARGTKRASSMDFMADHLGDSRAFRLL